MTTNRTLGFLMMMTVAAVAEAQPAPATRTLTVYFRADGNTNPAVVQVAIGVATKIFAAIGVPVEWRFGRAKSGTLHDGAVEMVIETGIPRNRSQNAMAYAEPYATSGTNVHILYNRVINSVPRGREASLLGHVMAHELGHVLQGVDRHSEVGVMKANFAIRDQAEMVHHHLMFTAFDAELIRERLNGTSSVPVLVASAR